MPELDTNSGIPIPKSGMPIFVWWILFLASPLLLLLGGFGIFRLFSWAAEQPDANLEVLHENLLLALLPILLYAFLSAIVAVHYVRRRVRQTTLMGAVSIANKHNYQQDFVRIIADNRPGSTLIVDGEGRIWFINAQAAAAAATTPQAAIGQSFEKTLQENDVLRLLPIIRQARNLGVATEVINKASGRNGMARFVKTQVIPLPATANMHNAVMINEDDVTTLLVEREARERMFRQVIDTLVAVVDRRDPYATGHSAHVGQIARAIAAQLNLEPVQIETAEIAGLLMNFGKVLVPREILVKSAILSNDELKQVHDSLLSSADILSLIGFSQPVVPTLRQALEHVDGSGVPAGLRGDSIMITARIVAVANAFVALISARAHRPGIDVSDAIDSLLQQAGKIYDKRVIEALVAVIASERHTIDWIPQA